MTQPLTRPENPLQKRHTIAAVVYFIYGVYYLFGAQYLTSMQSTQRGMSNPTPFLILGGIIAITFPFLIYRRTGIGVSFLHRASGQHRSFQVSFTLLLGLLVCARVVALLRGGLYLKSPLYTAALVLTVINAACLLWAGLGQAWWRIEATGSRLAISENPPMQSTGSNPWAS